MAKIDRIWNVEIRLGTTAVRARSYNIMLVYGPTVLTLDRTVYVNDADDLIRMGFDTNSDMYAAVSTAFSQMPSVDRLLVGKQLVDQFDITVDTAVNNTTYELELGWLDAQGNPQSQSVSFTSSGSATKANIASGLKTAIGAVTNFPPAVTTSGGTLSFNNNGSGYAYSVVPGEMLSIDTSSYVVAESMATGLAATEANTVWWYGLILTSRNTQDQKDAADWVEANGKLFLTSTDDQSNNGIMAYAKQNNLMRTAVCFHTLAESQYMDAALMSNRFTYHPGSESWANVSLSGVNADTGEKVITEPFIETNNITAFLEFRNVVITRGGKVGGDEWIDIIRFRDYLIDQIKVAETGVLIRATAAEGKVPYTDAGIQTIVAALRAQLDQEVGMGISMPAVNDQGDTIPSYTVSYPRASEVPDNWKAQRVLRNVRFTARLAGAIHEGSLQGSLVYSF